MTIAIEAVYENGVLRLAEPLEQNRLNPASLSQMG
jgi:hypothetical protein